MVVGVVVVGLVTVPVGVQNDVPGATVGFVPVVVPVVVLGVVVVVDGVVVG